MQIHKNKKIKLNVIRIIGQGPDGILYFSLLPCIQSVYQVVSLSGPSSQTQGGIHAKSHARHTPINNRSAVGNC